MINLDKYKAGNVLQSPSGYKYFLPTKVNDQWKWDNVIVNSLIEQAAIKLGELNSFSKLVPNIDLFIQLYVTKEAVVSSRIEGTQTKINEAVMNEDEISPERRNDWKEVNNYIKAVNFAVKELENIPISSRLIKQTHSLILDSVRGEHKMPGEYRTSQNWIGGSSPSDAVFIPPSSENVNELMSDLEKFLHNDSINLPALIKIAIAHYQFETIHPFLDGNGRIGRLLITLFLVDQKILTKPLLYLSAYFEKDKGLYYDNLSIVRTKNNMTQWLKYFLVGVANTAEIATRTLSEVMDLKARIEKDIHTSFGRKSHSANILLSYLFQHPFVYVNEVKDITNVSFKAANDLVADFVKADIIREITGQSRNRAFIFDDYLKLF